MCVLKDRVFIVQVSCIIIISSSSGSSSSSSSSSSTCIIVNLFKFVLISQFYRHLIIFF